MAKSPVYGRGRNRKHKGIHRAANHAAAANINMKGKKSFVDYCRCCECIDFRDKIRYKEHMKEIERGKDE